MKDALPHRVTSLRKRLLLLQGLTANAVEAGDLAALRRDLVSPAATLSELNQRQTMLSSLGVGTADPPSRLAARKRALTLRDRFRADRKASTLKKGVGWTSLLGEAVAAAKDVDDALKAGWRDFRSKIFSGEPPSVIEKRIAKTPGNLQALTEYQQAYVRFSALFQEPPTSAAAVETARRIAGELAEIATRFDFAVDPAVKQFLAAVQAGGAPLALLTSEVVTWLAENNAGDGYLIRAVDRS